LNLTDKFDIPSMIRLLSACPLLILITEDNQNCQLPGAKLALEATTKTYQFDHSLEKLKMDVEPHEPLRASPRHLDLPIE